MVKLREAPLHANDDCGKNQSQVSRFPTAKKMNKREEEIGGKMNIRSLYPNIWPFRKDIKLKYNACHSLII